MLKRADQYNLDWHRNKGVEVKKRGSISLVTPQLLSLIHIFFRWRLSLLSSAFSSGQKDNLSEDVLEEEQGYVADQGGSNRRYNPAQGNVSEDVPVQFPAAFGQADAHNGADNGLGAGNRNQGAVSYTHLGQCNRWQRRF